MRSKMPAKKKLATDADAVTIELTLLPAIGESLVDFKADVAKLVRVLKTLGDEKTSK